MTYKAKVAVCSEIHKKTPNKAGTMWSYWMLNLAVRKQTGRLWKVNTEHSAVP